MSQYSHDAVPYRVVNGSEGQPPDTPLLPPPTPGGSINVQIIGITVPLGILNAIFAIGMVTGQVVENVSLPLWAFALPSQTHLYFILSFASLVYVIVFGIWMLLNKIIYPDSIGEKETNFPHKEMMIIGACNSLNGLMVVYASARTPAYLQSILGNFLIPMTIGLRYIVLSKRNNAKQLLSAVLVLGGLFLALVPHIFKMTGESEQGVGGIGRITWPLCFMFGFLPAALMNVYTEKSLKGTSKRKTAQVKVDIIWFLFWTSLYQLISVILLFWTSLLPHFGLDKGLTGHGGFAESMKAGFQCYFGDLCPDGANALRGSIFMFGYISSSWFTAKLIRYAEGATWVAVVQTLVTPMGYIFYLLFVPKPYFDWKPHFPTYNWYIVGGLCIMIPGIMLYRLASDEADDYASAMEDDSLKTIDDNQNSSKSRDHLTLVV